jgi:hypothetical protein
MTDLASSPNVGATARGTNHNSVRVGIFLAVLVAVAAAFVFTIATTRGSGTAGLIRKDVQANFSTQSVSCHKVSPEPALTSNAIFACKVSGVLRANRPVSHFGDENFTRCFIRAGAGQTVDVSRAYSVLSHDHGKTAPCF